MGRLTPDRRRELLGAYALGAVDDDERAEVAELLLADEGARAELHALQTGVAWLDHASTGAPMHVWRAIEQEIEQEIAAEAEVGPGAIRARHDTRWPARLLALAAALVLGVVAAVGVLVARSDDAPRSVAALAAEARREPGATAAALRSADGSRVGSLVATDDGRAYLVWSARPEPAEGGRTYQLWEITPDGPRSAGLLGADARDFGFRLDAGTTAVAVTLEPQGGSPAPTGTPVVSAALA